MYMTCIIFNIPIYHGFYSSDNYIFFKKIMVKTINCKALCTNFTLKQEIN